MLPTLKNHITRQGPYIIENGLAVCQALRAEPDPCLCDVPIVMLTGVKLHEVDLVAAFAAGATDYLTKPVKLTLVRSRARAWPQRTSTA